MESLGTEVQSSTYPHDMYLPKFMFMVICCQSLPATFRSRNGYALYQSSASTKVQGKAGKVRRDSPMFGVTLASWTSS